MFQFLVWFSLWYCQWKPDYIMVYWPTTNGERGLKDINRISFLRFQRTIGDHSWPYNISTLPVELKNYLLSLIATKIDQIWEIGFDWRVVWYSGVGMMGQNSVVFKFGKGSAEGLKPRIKPTEAAQNCITYLKISFLGQLGGEISWKKVFLSYHPTNMSYEVEIWYDDLVGAIDVPFGGFDFSDSRCPFTAQKFVFLAWFTYFLNLFLA